MKSPGLHPEPLNTKLWFHVGEGSMTDRAIEASLDTSTGGVRLTAADGADEVKLHPIWLRERSREAEAFDPQTRQRLFDPPWLPLDLAVTDLQRPDADALRLAFSDGHTCRLSLARLAAEAGLTPDPEAPPGPRPWDASLGERPEADWRALADPGVFRELLAGYFRTGFCLVQGTPTDPGTLHDIARTFGTVRDTNFGPIFDVRTEAKPIDLAYTGRALSAHTDNPYRQPVPGIQILHCLVNEVAGGQSTLVDGFAVAERMAAETPELHDVLAHTTLTFRFESDNDILVNRGPMIERDAAGTLRRVRYSTRLDYVPALPPGDLDLYYRARRRLAELLADPAFEIRFRLEPGTALIMDNHRLLHGRTGFDTGGGHRHLQGCYIDHDGPGSRYRVLCRDAGGGHASIAAQ